MHTHAPRTSRYLLPMLTAGLAACVAPALGQVYHEDLELTASDGTAYDHFGRSIAIDNGIVAAGAWSDDDNGSASGSAYLIDASTGVQIAKLLPSDGAADDRFGTSIAFADGIVAVGARWDDDNGTDSGSAYLFDASTGVQIAKLLPSDGAADDWFGSCIAIANGIVAVGSPRDDDNGTDSGSVYLFDATTDAQIAKLLPSDGAASDRFGSSVAITNTIVAVGSPYDDDSAGDSGSAYLFSASTGTQFAKLLADDGEINDGFGLSIAIDKNIVAVGASNDDDNGSNSGSAYLFSTATGVQFAKLLPLSGAAGEQFGNSIALDSGLVAVGSFLHDNNGVPAGSAYLFDAETGARAGRLLQSDAVAWDYFGYSIAIDNRIVAVGASLDDASGTDSGSVYIFTVPEEDCRVDINDDGVVNTQDFLIFLNAWVAGDPIADWNEDGFINSQDIIAYLFHWVEGCP